jgi:hypothetical protein
MGASLSQVSPPTASSAALAVAPWQTPGARKLTAIKDTKATTKDNPPRAPLRDQTLDRLTQLLEDDHVVGEECFAETLPPLIGQHNLNEQRILYPICDRLLQSQQPVLDAALRQRLEQTSYADAA